MEAQSTAIYLPEDSKSMGVGQIRVTRKSQHPHGARDWKAKILLTVEADAYVYAWAFENGLSAYADDPATAVRYLAEAIIAQIEVLDQSSQMTDFGMAPMEDVEREYHRVYREVVRQSPTMVKDEDAGYEADFCSVRAA